MVTALSVVESPAPFVGVVEMPLVSKSALAMSSVVLLLLCKVTTCCLVHFFISGIPAASNFIDNPESRLSNFDPSNQSNFLTVQVVKNINFNKNICEFLQRL